MVHNRVMIMLACGHLTMGERICDECIRYYESVPCDLCADRVVAEPPVGCECDIKMSFPNKEKVHGGSPEQGARSDDGPDERDR
jgi:hypothetical protein